MSIADRVRLEELERRVAAIEQTFREINERTQRDIEAELARDVTPPQVQKTLTLKKQPNA